MQLELLLWLVSYVIHVSKNELRFLRLVQSEETSAASASGRNERGRDRYGGRGDRGSDRRRSGDRDRNLRRGKENGGPVNGEADSGAIGRVQFTLRLIA